MSDGAGRATSYTGILDGGGAPQCAPDCGRFFHQDGNLLRDFWRHLKGRYGL
ncbi:hypothetical protein ACFY78_33765 [Streptomyces olindensis]|uniref:hypothetical protein n=1 Tax=Streptomyces olindensis TaxID=358823 RepID=UPI0036814628